MSGNEQAASMVEQLLHAGRNAIRFHLEGDTQQEHQALEFMDSLWDRMSREERDRALEQLRAEGLQEFADRIDRERREMQG